MKLNLRFNVKILEFKVYLEFRDCVKSVGFKFSVTVFGGK